MKVVIEWLYTGSYDDTHFAIQDQHQEGTGQWFLDEVKDWLNKPVSHSVLWCRGIRKLRETSTRSLCILILLSRRRKNCLDVRH